VARFPEHDLETMAQKSREDVYRIVQETFATLRGNKLLAVVGKDADDFRYVYENNVREAFDQAYPDTGNSFYLFSGSGSATSKPTVIPAIKSDTPSSLQPTSRQPTTYEDPYDKYLRGLRSAPAGSSGSYKQLPQSELAGAFKTTHGYDPKKDPTGIGHTPHYGSDYPVFLTPMQKEMNTKREALRKEAMEFLIRNVQIMDGQIFYRGQDVTPQDLMLILRTDQLSNGASLLSFIREQHTKWFVEWNNKFLPGLGYDSPPVYVGRNNFIGK